MYFKFCLSDYIIYCQEVGHHGRDRMVVVFTTTCTCAISAYHH
jgi:hypothetical protein